MQTGDRQTVGLHDLGGEGQLPAVTTANRVTTEAALRALIGDPQPIVCAKVTDHLNHLTRQFIERSPFVCLATSGADGSCDVSPRGDPPGFVRILDDRTLLIPERPGNRLADTLRNIIANPRIGVLFLLPGIGDTFRVNGRAWLTDDAAVLAESAIEEKVPRLGIVVEIEEAYTQCQKAFIRSDLWNAEHFLQRSQLPSNGAIMKIINEHVDADQYDTERAARYARREGMY